MLDPEPPMNETASPTLPLAVRLFTPPTVRMYPVPTSVLVLADRTALMTPAPPKLAVSAPPLPAKANDATCDAFAA